MFWSGTYDTAIPRELPISHVMIYIGKRKADNKPILFGSSDGRTFDGQRRNGVSVFDFHIPKRGDKWSRPSATATFQGSSKRNSRALGLHTARQSSGSFSFPRSNEFAAIAKPLAGRCARLRLRCLLARLNQCQLEGQHFEGLPLDPRRPREVAEYRAAPKRGAPEQATNARCSSSTLA